MRRVDQAKINKIRNTPLSGDLMVLEHQILSKHGLFIQQLDRFMLRNRAIQTVEVENPYELVPNPAVIANAHRLYCHEDLVPESYGTSAIEKAQAVFNTIKHNYIRPECNAIYVDGYNRARKGKVRAFIKDYVSQNIHTLPTDLQENVLAEPIKGIYVDSSLELGACIELVKILGARTLITRSFATFSAQFQVKQDGTPLWRGDSVWLQGFGYYLVESFETDVSLDLSPSSPYSADHQRYRPTTYTAEKIINAPFEPEWHTYFESDTTSVAAGGTMEVIGIPE